MEILTEEKVRSNPYFTTGKYVPAAVNPKIKLPNCTTFCMCAWHWVFGAKKSYTLMKGRGPAGFGNAKEWYANYLFEKGPTPRVGAIAVWDGTYGHVAFVKSFNGNNITVYQSNYGGTFFEEKTYTVQVGATTGHGLGKFLGFCYHPYYSEDNKPATVEKSIEELAQEVLDGKWGNGANRKAKLTAAGYNYSKVQAKVNELLAAKNAPAKKSNVEIAKEVIAGKWGNGATRKKKLTEAGYNYAAIQAEVNKILKK